MRRYTIAFAFYAGALNKKCGAIVRWEYLLPVSSPVPMPAVAPEGSGVLVTHTTRAVELGMTPLLGEAAGT